MRIAVLGGGNGSFAAAGDLALAGHEVRMWRRDKAAVDAHRKSGGGIVVKDFRGRREGRPSLITSEIREAVHGAELIICPTPATAHGEIAMRLGSVLEDGQVVFLPPGTFGSMLIARSARDKANRAEVAYAETGTLPWLVRKHGPYEVAITMRAKRLPTGISPARMKRRALAVLDKAFPGVIEPCGDVLSGALMNAGPIIHPPLIVMNAAPLEHFARGCEVGIGSATKGWDIHKEGTQPSVRRVTDALDSERIAVRKALGYRAPHFPLADHYAKSGDEWMYGRGSHDKLTDSGDWRERIVLTEHRYMLEDVRVGLGFLVSVGRWAGVPTPLAQAFLSIGAAICGPEVGPSLRTFEHLGLDRMTKPQVKEMLREGLA